MSRYLNFYYKPTGYGCGLELHESWRVEVPTLERPWGIFNDENTQPFRAIECCAFDTRTTPPTIVSGSPWGASHPRLPEMWIDWNGDIVRRDGSKIMTGCHV